MMAFLPARLLITALLLSLAAYGRPTQQPAAEPAYAAKDRLADSPHLDVGRLLTRGSGRWAYQ
jgi:hypothetical protein